MTKLNVGYTEDVYREAFKNEFLLITDLKNA
jgi:hypothetical protein